MMDAAGIDGGLDACLLPQDAHEEGREGRDYFGTASGTHNQANVASGAFRDNHWTHGGHGCYKVLLAESYVFTGLALIFCCLALVCAAIEFAELISSADGECGPTSSSLLSYHNCTCLAAGEVVANYSSEAPMAFAVGQEEASQ